MKNIIFKIGALLIIIGFILALVQYSNRVSQDVIVIEQDNPQQEAAVKKIAEPALQDAVISGEKSTFYVTKDDCTNQCSEFSEGSEGLRYCQNLCGIIVLQTDNFDCALKSGLSKDYCYRDEAVAQSNQSVCKNISDKGLQAQCVNRITEDIIDEIF